MSSDLPQIILIGVIVILTVILVVLGIQIFFILKESKETLNKVNKILDGAQGIVGGASFLKNPWVKVILGTALTFFAGQKKIKELKEKQKTQVKVGKVRRFFKRS